MEQETANNQPKAEEKKRKYTKAEIEEIVLEMLKADKGVREISEKIGKSVATTYTIIRCMKGIEKREGVKLCGEIRRNVIAYLLKRGYSQRTIMKMIQTSGETIKNVKKSGKVSLSEDEIEEVIDESCSVEEFEKVQCVRKQVAENEKQITEMIKTGCTLNFIAVSLNMSGKELRGLIDKLVFEGRLELTEKNRYVSIPRENKKHRDENEEKNVMPMVKVEDNLERTRVKYMKKCRQELKNIAKKVENGDISLITKERCYMCCSEIVKNGETLTEEELSTLSETIAYGEGRINIESIRFLTNEYRKIGNLKPAVTLVNTCINTYGETEQLNELRDSILAMAKKLEIVNCLKQNMNIALIMDKTGAREAEIIALRNKYFGNGKAGKQARKTVDSRKKYEGTER